MDRRAMVGRISVLIIEDEPITMMDIGYKLEDERFDVSGPRIPTSPSPA